MKVSIIDTGTSNVSSVVNALKLIGHEYELIFSKSDLKNSFPLIIPGVGSFKSAMNKLKQNNIIDLLTDRVIKQGVPVLGICLGMQLLFESSEEFGFSKGLNFIKGNINKLTSNNSYYRIPNIGWSDVLIKKKSVMFPNINVTNESFYHVHSYYAKCTDEKNVAATIKFCDQEICVAVEHENIFGVQFHPEKSQDSGLNLLSRIIESKKFK